MKRALSYSILVIVSAIAGGLLYWGSAGTNAREETIVSVQSPRLPSQTATVGATAIPSVTVAADWERYSQDGARLIHQDAAGQKTIIAVPFAVSEYNLETTPYGILFWKKGPEKTTTVFEQVGEDQSFELPYEDGVDPEFQWYNFATETIHRLPTVDFANTGSTFDRVYSVHSSVTEPKVLIAVGEYDINGPNFEPGLTDSQPERTRGLVFDLAAGQFSDDDPLTPFLEALEYNSTIFIGLGWDSIHQRLAAAPAGEGCGRYEVVYFMDTATDTLTTVGGPGSFDFVNGDYCNPANAVSSDGRWFVLEGMKGGGTTEGILFDITQGSTQVKRVEAVETRDAVERLNWDLSQPLPILRVETSVFDFNR